MNNKLYTPAIILLAFIPAIVGSILIFGISGKFITDFHLAFSETDEIDIYQFLDEKYHWHQINTFQEVGFEGGYYTVRENEPEIDFFRYYSWGPYPTIFYGSISALTGFDFYTPILINTAFFAIAVLILGFVTRLSYLQIGILAIIFALFPNIVLYYPSLMLEMLNLSIAVYLAIIFYQILRDKPLNNWWILIGIFLIFIAGLMRVSWIILFIPYCGIIGWKKKKTQGLIAGLLIAALLFGFVYLLFTNSHAPYPALVEDNSSSLFTRMAKFVLRNLLFSITGVAYWVLLRFASYIIIVGTLFQGLLLLRKKEDLQFTAVEFWFHIINLGGITVANLLLNDSFGGHDARAMGPHLLLSIIVLILLKRYRFIIPILMILILMFPNFLRTHSHDVRAHFADYQFDIAAYQTNLIDSGITYIETDNGWCNSLLFDNSLNTQPELFFAIPAGIGVSRFSALNQIDGLPRSHYMLLSDTLYREAQIEWNIEWLVDIPNGSIYRNLDANCP